MPVWILLVAVGVGTSVFYSPWAWLLLALAFVTAILPRAAVTMVFSCALGALVSPLLARANPSPEAWLMSFLVWAFTYVMLWLFVSTGLWRKKKP